METLYLLEHPNTLALSKFKIDTAFHSHSNEEAQPTTFLFSIIPIIRSRLDDNQYIENVASWIAKAALCLILFYKDWIVHVASYLSSLYLFSLYLLPPPIPIKLRNSCRVFARSLNTPNMQLVTVDAPGFWTPLIAMHMCSASMTTATPCGVIASSNARATCFVRRSCTCSLRAKVSAILANLERPMTRRLGR